MNKNKSTIIAEDYFPWIIMILMSSVTFVGILSELMPSGVLPQMMQELNLNEVQGGNLVGYYALASAIFSIPLISVTMHYNRKLLLLLLLGGFAISNFIVALVSNYAVVVLFSLNYNFKEQEVIKTLRKKCEILFKLLKEKHIDALAGLGCIAKNLSDLSQSYKDAWQAANLCKKLQLSSNPAYISDLSLPKLLLSLPPKNCNDFCKDTLNPLISQNDWPDLKKTIITWCESYFSLTKTALKLKVHRHTILYRLNKVEQITGLKLRDCFEDVLKVYLAIKIEDLI